MDAQWSRLNLGFGPPKRLQHPEFIYALRRIEHAGLVAVVVGTYALAPDRPASALSVPLLAICPLSMMFMMESMRHGQDRYKPDVGTSANDSDRDGRITWLPSRTDPVGP